MIKEIWIHFARFVFLIIFQIVVLNNIQLSGFVVAYAYILFILLLPVEIKPLTLLLASFALGICMDLFSYSPGMHAASCLVLGFVRPSLLNVLMPRDSVSGNMTTLIQRLGVFWFFRYTFIMVLIHHSVLFFLEAFELSHILYTLTRIAGSSIFSTGILLMTGYLIAPRKPV